MPQDALALLLSDHDAVRKLLKEFEDTTEQAVKTRPKLLSDIEREMRVHMAIEDEIFYPAYKAAVEKKEDRELYFEAKEEHDLVEKYLPELAMTDPSTEQFTAKATVLKELVEHHAEDEEKEMFPAARKVMSAEELLDLGVIMEARKKELLEADAAAA